MITSPTTRPLERPHLGRAHVAAIVAVAVAITGALFAATPLQGRADFLLVAVAVYVALLGATARLVEGPRAARDRLAMHGLYGMLALALLPLVAVLAYTVNRGAQAISLNFLTHSMKGVGPLDPGGGAYHAIVGTLEQVGIATLISVPLGLLAAVYLVEYGRGRFAGLVRFVVDVMTGIPSIVAGLFVFAFWVVGLHRGFSGLAAALALTVLMLPVVVRTSEEMLKLVPADLREASWALGVPRWRTIVSVVLPSASAGLTTGVMLAIARVTGETAPLLLTAFGFDAINTDPVHGPQSALPLYVFGQAQSAFDVAVDRAWAGALTLIVVVLLLTTTARLLTRRNRLA
ncbi:MAG: phosphate transport system permease protein [Actinomycetota bacterium]|jgi:phosphate transport system permease protein